MSNQHIGSDFDDCAEGGKHEDRDCDRTGEEFQGDV